MKEDKSFLKNIFEGVWFVLKIPYFIIRWFVRWIKNIRKELDELSKSEKSFSVKNTYERFAVLQTEKGDFLNWEKTIFDGDSFIGVILGARGKGKSALGIKILENMKIKTRKKFYTMGFHNEDLPKWIKNVESVEGIKNDSIVLIDEGGVFYGSRNSMSVANKFLSKLLLISRHKNLSILFISQNSSNLEVNVLRQADFLLLKPSSLLQKDFERKIVSSIYDKESKNFVKLKKDKGLLYIYSDEFRGFVSNKLPTFWKDSLSKSFGNE